MSTTDTSFRVGVTKTLGSPDPGSQISNDPLWGRAWKLTVVTADAKKQILTYSGWEPEALRCTFEIQESVLPSAFWYALITVYNVDDLAIQNLMWNAQWATLEAGYQIGVNKAGIIWNGPVIQVMYDRPMMVDNTVTFNCVSTLPLLEDNFVDKATGPIQSQYDAIAAMLRKQGGDPGKQISDLAKQRMQSKVYPRGRSYWGSSNKYIEDSASGSFLTSFIKEKQPYITALIDPNTPLLPEITYGPPYPPGYVTAGGGPTDANNYGERGISRSLIGVPQQTPFGVNFNVLLDPRVHVGLPPQLVQLESTSLIQMLRFQIGDISARPVSQDGIYIVSQVTHRGDTRGNDWVTQIFGYSHLYSKNLLYGLQMAKEAGVK